MHPLIFLSIREKDFLHKSPRLGLFKQAPAEMKQINNRESFIIATTVSAVGCDPSKPKRVCGASQSKALQGGHSLFKGMSPRLAIQVVA